MASGLHQKIDPCTSGRIFETTCVLYWKSWKCWKCWDSESPMLWQCKGSVHNCHENVIKNLQVSAWPKQRRRTKQRCRWKPVKSTPIEMTRKGRKRKHAKGGRKADQTIEPKVNSKGYPSEDSMSMVECGSKWFKYLQYFLNSETSQ